MATHTSAGVPNVRHMYHKGYIQC